MTAEQIIHSLHLAQHPEGGFYRETYKGETTIILDEGKARSTCTAIYYLLKDDDKSHFHKVSSDEMWLFHQGKALEIFVITDKGEIEVSVLGNNLESGESPQAVVKANTWFAAQVRNQKGYALVSCIVAPGFEFDDFELAEKDELIKSFPGIKEVVERFSL